MIKGGGAALTREKIVAAQSQALRLHRRCIQAGERAGRFPAAGGGDPDGGAAHDAAVCAAGRRWRRCARRTALPLVTDNGQHILDVTGLRITDPLGFESEVNQWPGVVTVGVFAHQKRQRVPAGHAIGGVKTTALRLSGSHRRLRTGCRPDCSAAAAGGCGSAALRPPALAPAAGAPAPAAVCTATSGVAGGLR